MAYLGTRDLIRH